MTNRGNELLRALPPLPAPPPRAKAGRRGAGIGAIPKLVSDHSLPMPPQYPQLTHEAQPTKRRLPSKAFPGLLPAPPQAPQGQARTQARLRVLDDDDDNRSEASFYTVRTNTTGMSAASKLSAGRIDFDLQSEASSQRRGSQRNGRRSSHGSLQSGGDVLAGPAPMDPLAELSTHGAAPLPPLPQAPSDRSRSGMGTPPRYPDARIPVHPSLMHPTRPAVAPGTPEIAVYQGHDYIGASARSDSPLGMIDGSYPLPLPPVAPPPGAPPAAQLTMDNLQRHNVNKPLESRPHRKSPRVAAEGSPGRPPESPEMEELRRQNEELQKRVAALEGGTTVRHAIPVATPMDPARPESSSCCLIS